MSAQAPIGELIDARGVRAAIADEEIVTDVVVLLRGVGEDSKTFIRAAWSEGMDWIMRRGIIEVARDQEVTFPSDGGGA